MPRYNLRRLRFTDSPRFRRGLVLAFLVFGVAATAHAQRRQPPAANNANSLTGRDTFTRYCASCHGREGKGDGPVAEALKTRPADLSTLTGRSNGTFPAERVRRVITGGGPFTVHGRSDMPVWGDIFTQLDPSERRVTTRIDNLVEYIRTLQAPGSGGDDPGAKLFATYCASCHGKNGRGDGPVSAELRRMPPDLTRFAARNGGVFPRDRVYRIIDGREVRAHGDRTMPVWGDAFSRTREELSDADVRQRLDAIVRYLEAIQQRPAE